MKASELRKFTLDYYNNHLKGKTAIIKKYLKEVVFTSKAGKKIAIGEAMYSAKAVAVQHLQELIENSTYNNWGDRKNTDSKDVLGYLNFKSKLTIDGEKRHLRISLTMFKNRKTELKNIEVGNKKKLVKPTQASVTNSETIGFNQLSNGKITKNSESSKQKPQKSGLGLPLTDEIRKKAFTDKGKLRKGWYYEENGLLTNGKDFYLSDNKKEREYKVIAEKLIQTEANYRGVRFQAEDLAQAKGIENNKIRNIQWKTFYEEVTKYLQKEFPSITKEDVWDIHNTTVTKDNVIYFNFSAEDRKIKAVKDFLAEFSTKEGGKYKFNKKALLINERISEFIKKQNDKLLGNTEKIRKKYGLSAPQIPFFENLKQAKKYFLDWALKNLRGKKIYHKELEKWVLFNRVGIEHTLSNRISLEKMTLILQAENMLKKSQLIKFEEENKGRTNIKGVYRMRSVGVVEGEEKEVIITLREGENGVIYYDHKVEIKNPLSTRKSSAKPKNLLDNGFSDRKNTQKSESSKQKPQKSGLGLPLTDEIRKKAFTNKGKLRKGWYYEENGLLTNGKDFYIKDLEYAQEYNAIERKIAQRNNPKSKELLELFIKKNDKENEYYREQRGIIIDDLLRKYDIKNKVDFRYFFIDKFVIKDELRKLAYIDKGYENKLMRAFKDLAKEINKDKFGFTYSLTPKGEEILSEYLEKEKELFIKAHGNPQKIKKKYGLSAPQFFESTNNTEPTPNTNPTIYLGNDWQPQTENNSEPTAYYLPNTQVTNFQNLANQMANTTNYESFLISNPEISNFFGDLEKKTHHSLLITLAGGQGSGKTRFAFQFINALAQHYSVAHFSLEEHPQSRLYTEKVMQYISDNALHNITPVSDDDVNNFEQIIENNDVIVIDSFAKMREIFPKFEVDKDLRKKYNGKLFLVIFQQTSNGNMRGGSKSQYDGDIILFTQTFPDYRENYVYPNKNRYTNTPLHLLKYNIHQQKMINVS